MANSSTLDLCRQVSVLSFVLAATGFGCSQSSTTSTGPNELRKDPAVTKITIKQNLLNTLGQPQDVSVYDHDTLMWRYVYTEVDDSCTDVWPVYQSETDNSKNYVMVFYVTGDTVSTSPPKPQDAMSRNPALIK